MRVSAPPAKPRGLALMFGWRRLRFTLGLSIALGVVLSLHHVPPWPHWKPTLLSALTCTLILGLVAMLVFGLLERIWREHVGMSPSAFRRKAIKSRVAMGSTAIGTRANER